MTRPFFQNLRDLVWPIYGHEHKIWLPMATMVGLILFNYTVARNVKDSLVVTATGSSEIIPFLKGALVLPASILFFFLYAKLATIFSKRMLFYIVVAGFMLSFIFFALVLYPHHETLHPHASADTLQAWLPRGLRGLADCYRVWTFAYFYVISELWGVASVGLLFWQFANDVIRVADAKRFYGHFYLLANVFVALSGVVTAEISLVNHTLVEGSDYWGQSILHLVMVMTGCFISILFLYFYLDRYIFDEKYMANNQLGMHCRNKILTMSVKDGLRYLFKSRYLGLLAMLLICYGITANLLEVAWKRQLVMVFSSGNDYAVFMGHLSTATGIGTIVAIFLGSILLRKVGWLTAALITPLTVGIAGCLFFLAVIFPSSISFIAQPLNWSALVISVNLGFALEVLIKSIKYALFDPTKEMAYIPLEDEAKIRGKAAVDVVANRLGKSTGGFFEIALLALAGSMGAAVSYFAVFFVLFSACWVAAVVGLHRKFAKLLAIQRTS